MVTPTVLSAFFPDYYEREKTERYIEREGQNLMIHSLYTPM